VKSKVVVTRRWPEEVEAAMAERYNVSFNKSDQAFSQEELRRAFETADAVCTTVTDRIDSEVLGVPTVKARMIGNFGVGFNHIELDLARSQGIAVTNTPDVLTECTADIAMMLILMAARRAGEGERLLRAQSWRGWAPTAMLGASVAGKTIGIIGFGRIGRAVAHRAHHGFGMRVLCYSRSSVAEALTKPLLATQCSDLGQLLQASDVVSVHCPGGAETNGLIDADAMEKMRRGAILINTARGGIVNESALIDALARGQIAAAGLDVFEQEPQVPAGLLSLDNVVLLPHLGSATRETRVAMGMRVLENLDAFFAGRELPDRIV